MFKPQCELGIKHTIKLSHPGKTVYLTYFLFLVHVQTCCFFFSLVHQLTLQTLNFKSCLVFCLVT